MLTVLISLFSFSSLYCSSSPVMFDPVRWSNFFVQPRPPRVWENRHQSNQPIFSDTCKGIVPWTCLCHPEVPDSLNGPGTSLVEWISCKNSRLTDTDVLLSLRMFPNLRNATFYGNNFVELSERILGRTKQKSLLYLNLSNNNLLYLNQDSFVGMPSLQSLDLSENGLCLREGGGDWLFLRPLRYLRGLFLRRAFYEPLVNASAQLILLERGLRHARLRDLQFLDLSENEFDYFPPTLVCLTPSLTHLILASNRLRVLHFDKRCNIELKALDLRWNRLKYFDFKFTNAVHKFGPISVQATENPFDCSSSTCESFYSIKWFKSTKVIKDKETIRCQAAIPGSESTSDDYRPDSYLLYPPVKQGLHCPQYEATPQPIPPKTASAPGLVRGEEANLTLTILTMDGADETFANNSAAVFAPFRLFVFGMDKISYKSSRFLSHSTRLPQITIFADLLHKASSAEFLIAAAIFVLLRLANLR